MTFRARCLRRPPLSGIASGLLAGIIAAVLVKIAESKFGQLTGKGSTVRYCGPSASSVV
jgi:hypothetical protein